MVIPPSGVSCTNCLYMLSFCMKRRISLFIATVFLAVQVLAFLHMAEFGLKDHKHQGKLCEISQYCELAKIAGVILPVIPAATHYVMASYIGVYSHNHNSLSYLPLQARAPPYTIC